MKDPSKSLGIEIPAESLTLKAAYKKTGLTIGDLASATGLSVGSVHIALNGYRYRDGEPRVAVPPDRTLVQLASVLHLAPELLRSLDRGRAADLLEEMSAQRTTAGPAVAQAGTSGERRDLARQILATFTIEELEEEIERREHEAMDGEGDADALADLKADWGVP